MWFRRGYLAVALVLLVLHSTKVVDLMRLLTPTVVVLILVALTVVPAVFERMQVCRRCASRSIEVVPSEPPAPRRPPEVAEQEMR